MKTTVQKIILLDTDSAINFFASNESEFHKGIVNKKSSSNAFLMVSVYTWYELFKSAKDLELIKLKLNNIYRYSDGMINLDEVDTSLDSLFNPQHWLQNDLYKTSEFALFIERLEKIVYNKINPHIIDILLVSIYMLLITDHLLDINNKDKIKLLVAYKDFVLKKRDEFLPALKELLNRNLKDVQYFDKLLNVIYKGLALNTSIEIETEFQFISRIKKIPYSNVLNIFKRINNETNGEVKYDLTSKDSLLKSIYKDFYDAPIQDELLVECKEYLFTNSPIGGRRFDRNDYIDMSNLLLSKNTPGATISYITNDKKWLKFISVFGGKYGFN